MLREDRFVQSHRPYAVNLASLAIGGSYVTLDAVWFRRRAGRTVACVGKLWDIQQSPPADAEQFLKAHDDGRYGGDCHGRWDGARYWGAQEPEGIEAHLALLRPMLAGYPAAPAGFEGWWRFERPNAGLGR